MSIRLSGAQVTRISEALERHKRIQIGFNYNYRDVPFHIATEELVEDILKEVLPCPINTAPTPNAPQNASVS
jgi:hypothetical protein